MDSDGLAHLVGHTALVEIGGGEATGTVTSAEGWKVTVTCDVAPWAGPQAVPAGPSPAAAGGQPALSVEVEVSVFAPDALYRISGRGEAEGVDLVLGPEASVERIQRRKWPRRRLDLPVTVCPVADGRRLEGVPGRTVDVGVGGMCVETLRPVEGEGDPMVILSLPDGTSLVSLTATVASQDLGDGWRYRLAFRDLDPHDAGRIAELVG